MGDPFGPTVTVIVLVMGLELQVVAEEIREKDVVAVGEEDVDEVVFVVLDEVAEDVQLSSVVLVDVAVGVVVIMLVEEVALP